jgi:protein TonB
MLAPGRTQLGKLGLMLFLACSNANAKPAWEPVGLAAYTETSRDIYVAALLMPAGGGSRNVAAAPGPKAMEYRIATRRVSKRGFTSMILLQAEMGSGNRAPKYVADTFNQLHSVIKGPLLRGDHFVVALSADNVTTFYLNDTTLLRVENRSVFDFFFAGWLGGSASIMLRDSLLAGTIDPALLARHGALRPDQDRAADIAAWIAPVTAVTVAPPTPPIPPESAETPNNEAPEPEPVLAASEMPGRAATKKVSPADQAKIEPARESATAEAAVDVPEPTIAAPGPDIGIPKTVASVAAETPGDDMAQDLAVTPLSAPREPGELAAMQHATVAGIAPEEMQQATQEKTQEKTEYKRERDRYITNVMKKVIGNVDYPRRAIAKEREGKVELLARLARSGELLDLTLDNSSGYTTLDDAARLAVRRAAPFAELPPEALEEFTADDGKSYVVTIPVTFKLLN